jgi:hypothetical protein
VEKLSAPLLSRLLSRAVNCFEDCEKGFFVCFDYSSDALQEIESFFKRSHKVIVTLTMQEILDEHIAKQRV